MLANSKIGITFAVHFSTSLRIYIKQAEISLGSSSTKNNIPPMPLPFFRNAHLGGFFFFRGYE